MILAVAALSVMDAFLKLLSPHYSALQITSIRGLASLPIVLVWAGLHGGYGQLLQIRFPLHLFRAAIGIATLASFTYALKYLPLSEVYSLFFVAPLLITAMAVPILGERVDRARWIAIAIGFAGVLIVLKPSGSGAFTLPGLAVLAAAAGYAMSAITVRVLGRTDSTQSIVVWLMLLIGLGAGLLAIPGWKNIRLEDWPVILGIAISGSVGQWAITEAFQRGEASVVAPFEYISLAWGAGLDWFFWSSIPGARTYAGAAVIIASGLYLIKKESVRAEAEHP